MKRSTKASLQTGLKALLFFGVLAGLIGIAAMFAPDDSLKGATFLNDVADRHRY